MRAMSFLDQIKIKQLLKNKNNNLATAIKTTSNYEMKIHMKKKIDSKTIHGYLYQYTSQSALELPPFFRTKYINEEQSLGSKAFSNKT